MAKSKGYGGLIFLLVVVAAAAAGTFYYYKGKGDKKPEFATVKVSRGNIRQVISATGNLQTTNQVTVSSQVSGNVIDINADFNSVVKKGQWLLKIDPSTYEQRLRQAKANLESAKASNARAKSDAARTKALYEQNLATKAEYEASVASIAQADSSLISAEATYANAEIDLERCTIYSPIDGVILNRTTDVGGTVNVNQSAVALFTIINDLSKLQISADVSEADIGNVVEGQTVYFTVDAYLNRSFEAKVQQVRNFAKNTSGVVTFSVIIGVDNSNNLLKPGMTATANIVIAERSDVLVVQNNALRVRIPVELQDKMAKAAPAAPAAAAKEVPAAPAAPAPGAAPVAAVAGAEEGAGRGRGGRGGGRGGRGGGGNFGAGMNVSNRAVTVYKLGKDAAGNPIPEPTTVHLGISDGSFTQILDGVNEGDSLITYVTMPGAAVATPAAAPSGQSGNPFGGGGRGMGGGGFGGGGRGF